MAMLNLAELEIVTLKDVGISDEIIEDGKTMKENAWIKANNIRQKVGGNIIGEDSGLEVDALDGAPGIFSARYAGPQRNDDDNIEKVLQNMESENNRGAQYRSVLAVWYDDHQYTFEGIVKGRLTKERIGSGGFGYDPIFIPEGYQDTFGVLPPSVKNQISHRFKALKQFRKMLLSHLS